MQKKKIVAGGLFRGGIHLHAPASAGTYDVSAICIRHRLRCIRRAAIADYNFKGNVLLFFEII